MVLALIETAHTLHLSVVAEGVETQQQLEMLRAVRCDGRQGFLLGWPQHTEELTWRFASAGPVGRAEVLRFNRLTRLPLSA